MVLILFYLLASDVVANGLQPEGDSKVTITRDLVLGGEDVDEEQMFSATANLAVGDGDVIYVMDSGNFRVSIFEKNGSFRKSFGEKGPGPGEFSEPVAIAVDSKHVLIFDTGTHKMYRYDLDGQFIEEKRFASNIHGLFKPLILPGGNLVFTAYKLTDGMQIKYDSSLYGTDLAPIRTFQTLAMPKLEWDNASNPTFWVSMLKDQFEMLGRGFPMNAVAGDTLITMVGSVYEGELSNTQGKRIGGFSKEFKPRVLSEEAKMALCEPIWQNLAANPALSANMGQAIFDRALGQVANLDRAPPIQAIASLEKGFAVLANYHPLKREGFVDVFNAKGKLLGIVPYKGGHQFFTGKGSYLYAVGPDDDDYLTIERFKVSMK